MITINTKVSSIKEFKEKNEKEYTSIIQEIDKIINECEKQLSKVIEKKETLNRQISNLKSIEDDVKLKNQKYQNEFQEFSDKMEVCQSKIAEIYNNPIEVTTTDSNGNTVTEKRIDETALRDQERQLEQLKTESKEIKIKLDNTKQIMDATSEDIKNLEDIYNAIQSCEKEIETFLKYIQNYLDNVEREVAYNKISLENVINSLQNYLASKKIYAPTIATYSSSSTIKNSNIGPKLGKIFMKVGKIVLDGIDVVKIVSYVYACFKKNDEPQIPRDQIVTSQVQEVDSFNGNDPISLEVTDDINTIYYNDQEGLLNFWNSEFDTNNPMHINKTIEFIENAYNNQDTINREWFENVIDGMGEILEDLSKERIKEIKDSLLKGYYESKYTSEKSNSERFKYLLFKHNKQVKQKRQLMIPRSKINRKNNPRF